MGLEYISQPQVFLSPITAVGGIQNGLFGNPLPPLYTSFYTWTSTSSIEAATYFLDGIETLTDRSGSYIVTVGGVVQSPTNYTVNPNTRTLTFDFVVKEDTPVVVTQIGTLAPSATLVNNITATNTVTTSSINFVSSSVLPKTTFNNLVSALAIQVNGTTLYLPLLSAI